VQSGLFSIPQRFGIAGALWISRVFHLSMLACLLLLVRAFELGPLALAGVAAVAALLAWEHRLVHADDLSRVDAAFFTMNGYVSVIFFVFWATDILLRMR
jgi:4-hydroxybenzoate polyprenyltransferase